MSQSIKYTTILLLCILSFSVKAQDNPDAKNLQQYNLSDILREGGEHYALKGRDSIIQEIEALNIKNLTTNWYPNLQFEGKASWQSDVTTIDLPIPGVDLPELPQDQYKLSVNLTQMIYDGGLTSSAKELEKLKSDIANGQLQSSYLPLYKQLSKLFHSILLLQDNRETLLISQKRLSDKKAQIQALIDNGMAKESQLNLITIESIKILQQLDEISYTLKTLINNLKVLTGLDLIPEQLVLTNDQVLLTKDAQNRWEVKLLQLKSETLDLQSRIEQQKQLPKLGAFTQIGYGKPGLNMFSSEFKEYAIVGINLNWNIYDWGNGKRNREKFKYEQEKISQDLSAFQRTYEIETDQLEIETQKYQQQIERQKALIELRKQIVEDKAKQVANDQMILKDYLDESNLLLIDEIKLNQLKINLAMVIANYNLVIGG